uniref:Uncharacterized protein n=1 Tax=mine drainage metagenome TaxID=410659 RepID=E6PIT2_9ZZZZ
MTTASTSEKVRQTIRTSDDRVFTTRDVLNSTPGATRELVDQVISRMVRSGELQRISRGLFSRPKVHPQLGPLSPDTQDIAAAVERSIGMPVFPSGAFALNALHLSTQVPAKPEFMTAGPSRTIYIGKLPIRLKHASARRFRIKTYIAQLVIEALRALGQGQVTEKTIKTIRDTIAKSDRDVLRNHIGDAPVWMQAHLRRIAAE